MATEQLIGIRYVPVRFILVLLSGIYYLISSLLFLLYKNRFLKVHMLKKPVISVGNITWGGVGKTPLVEYICQYLMDQGVSPAVLMRGYMDQRKKLCEIDSDEAVMLRSKFPGVPIITGPDRVKSAESLSPDVPVDVLVLDDGFQHWRVRRDLDLVVIDATNPWGNDQLLPRGILRERFKSLKRADMIVITKADLERNNVVEIRSRLKKVGFQGGVVEAIHESVRFVHLIDQDIVPLEFVGGKKIVSFCSIGNPESFEVALRNLDAEIVHQSAFLDHYIYEEKDIVGLNTVCRKNDVNILVTTWKDAAKLKGLSKHFDKDLLILILEIKISIITGKEDFFGRINSVIHR